MKQLGAATLIIVLSGTVAIPQGRANRGSLSGTVLCEDTKTPARGAYVWLQRPVTPGAFTPPAEAFGATTGVERFVRDLKRSAGRLLRHRDIRGIHFPPGIHLPRFSVT